ncbi:hypothetical protein [Streptomyces sp. S.PNR 29]|uniref:hypothetical protein n=1 Tax=Streptomyces sp. S.PNR 29 TaxID=2973805 RepID=UPI0025B01024|nr:hypothetical protein [Streptomyces sp. S.PNR 29]MDN0201226.1 hypothetical protein [Streptomyces sp. S.PNR 29]
MITPVAANTPPSRRDIALDDDEITLLSAGWEQAERFDADGLAVVILRGPGHTTTTVVDKPRPTGHAVSAPLATRDS